MLDIFNTATLLPLADIRTDGGTQARAKLDQATINRYAEDLRDGAEFPPIDVYFDGVDYWLANGFHRLHAHLLAELEEIYTTIHQGTQRDAILHSLGANADHGLPRSDDDKRRSVLRMLRDPEWNQWSNSEIARRCRVSESYVRKLKKEQGIDTSHSAKYTHPKTGETTTMNTANIGASTQQHPLRRQSSAEAGMDGEGLTAAGLPPLRLVNRATSPTPPTQPTAPSPPDAASAAGRDGEGYSAIAQALADARTSAKWAQDHMPAEQTTSNGALHMALRKIIADIDVANHLTNRLIKKSE